MYTARKGHCSTPPSLCGVLIRYSRALIRGPSALHSGFARQANCAPPHPPLPEPLTEVAPHCGEMGSSLDVEQQRVRGGLLHLWNSLGSAVYPEFGFWLAEGVCVLVDATTNIWQCWDSTGTRASSPTHQNALGILFLCAVRPYKNRSTFSITMSPCVPRTPTPTVRIGAWTVHDVDVMAASDGKA